LRQLTSSPVGILWLLRARDCLSCQLPTRELRHLQRGSEVPLVVVIVGGGAQRVADFLRGERLTALLHGMTWREYRDTFGRLPLPALYVVRRDSVVGVWSLEDSGAGLFSAASGADLGAVLRRLVGAGAPVMGAPAPKSILQEESYAPEE
jgi:hypothetical protein